MYIYDFCEQHILCGLNWDNNIDDNSTNQKLYVIYIYIYMYMYIIKKIVQECATTCAYLEQRNQITETN